MLNIFFNALLIIFMNVREFIILHGKMHVILKK